MGHILKVSGLGVVQNRSAHALYRFLRAVAVTRVLAGLNAPKRVLASIAHPVRAAADRVPAGFMLPVVVTCLEFLNQS